MDNKIKYFFENVDEIRSCRYFSSIFSKELKKCKLTKTAEMFLAGMFHVKHSYLIGSFVGVPAFLGYFFGDGFSLRIKSRHL